MIQLFRPELGQEELDALKDVFQSAWIGLGPKTAEFEAKFAEYVGARYAVAMNSATAALHISLVALGIGPGDEVIVPTITFISTAHAVAYTGATPVFADVDRDTLQLSYESVRDKMTKRTRAIIPVHYGGFVGNMEELWRLARYAEHDGRAYVIEDAAHACGSSYRGQMVGPRGESKCACFSFHAVKNLACGDGGMITTNDLALAQAARRLRWCGINKSTWDRTEESDAGLGKKYGQYSWYYEVAELGYKCHMNDITAAIGLVQLKKLEAANARRREIAALYDALLPEWVKRPPRSDDVISATHNYTVQVPADKRDALSLFLKDAGVATGVHYLPLHLHPYYRHNAVRLPVAEEIWQGFLTLPMYPSLMDKTVQYIAEKIDEFGKD